MAASATSITPRIPEGLRADFPALSRLENGLPVAYFDGPGGTQVPRAVVEAVADTMLHANANTHWAFGTSVEIDRRLAAAREACAEFLNARPENMVFGPNMTSLTFHLGRALAPQLGPGDEIVVTELDHHANVDPWRRLARERGATVRTARILPEAGILDWDDLVRQLNVRTKLLALGAASNALGTLTDVTAATKLAHDVGAMVFIDAVHWAPHALIDVAAIGCDFLACSAYKFYGPHVGILFGRSERLAELDPPRLEPAPALPPEHLETGTKNHEGLVGTLAAIDWLAGLAGQQGASRRERLAAAYALIQAHERQLLARLWNGLGEIPGVRRVGPPLSAPRTPTVSFHLDRVPAEGVCRRLAREFGVYCSHGDFYASTVVARLGLRDLGLVRAGIAAYSTASEVDRLLTGIAAIQASS